jgi:nicotinate-nucleotide adenylyltransferase
MRLGIYVGSFNPVHKGHEFIANYVVNNNYVDKVLMIPTESYWDKKGLVDLKHRLNMLKFCENENILVSDEYSSYEFTNEILTALTKKLEDTELYLIIGADNLLKFELWENIDEILKHKVLVLGRDDIDMEEQIKKFTEEQQQHFVLVKEFPEVDVSSTTVRKKLEACKTNELSNELENDVLKYILDNKLYCSQI